MDSKPETCEFCDNISVIDNGTIYICKDHMSKEALERAENYQSLKALQSAYPQERESLDEDPIL